MQIVAAWYEKCEEHAENNARFRNMMAHYGKLRFFQPSPEKAPWHWQAYVGGRGPYHVLVNFWPHTAKAQRHGETSVEGWGQIYLLMGRVIGEDGGFGL